MKYCYLTIGLACLLTASGCAKNEPPGKAAESVILKINGKPLSEDTFNTYASMVTGRPAQELTPEKRTQLLDAFVAMQLTADSAEKTGIAKTPEVQTQLTLSRMNLLSNAQFKKHLADHPIADADLKAEFDAQVAAAPREYRARHILVESRATADDLIAQLNKGADFAKLAEKNSIDGSAKQGGDLGWLNLGALVPEFSAAVTALEKGKYSTTPVKTQFGWHVIKVDDTRALTPPSFDDVKDKVRQIVQEKTVRNYVLDLRKAAKIEKVDSPKTDAAKPDAATDAAKPANAPAETK